jgi:glycosyltransferase involved in cell wall biosynthesis
MACGLPVVSTDLVSVKAYAPSKDAILIKDNEPRQFVDAILHLVQDKYERQAMAIAARKRAEELDWRNVVMQYEDLYSAVSSA